MPMSFPFQQDWFEELPVVGILRGFDGDDLRGIVEAAIRGGLRNIEITMNSPGATTSIARTAGWASQRMNVGAGTVLNEAQLEDALKAGASFIVTPVVNEAIIHRCVSQRVPVFTGSFTPTEIHRAWESGATMVKVFPADRLGPSYIKNLKGPLPHIRLMPTGGMSLDTLEAFVDAGAEALGVGSPLFHPERVRKKDWPWIESQCRAFSQEWGRVIARQG